MEKTTGHQTTQQGEEEMVPPPRAGHANPAHPHASDHGGQREKRVDPTEGVAYAGGKISQVANQTIAIQRDSRTISTEIHQVRHQECVGQYPQYGDSPCHAPRGAEKRQEQRKAQDETYRDLVHIALHERERGKCRAI